MSTPNKSRCDACGAAHNGCPMHAAAPALVAALERIEGRAQELADRGGRIEALECGGLAEEARIALFALKAMVVAFDPERGRH